jgi:mono/diheme cytochrome c family protein
MQIPMRWLGWIGGAALCLGMALPPIGSEPAGPLQDDYEASRQRGKEVYFLYCVTCHLGDGKGTPGVYPPLAGSDFLLEDPGRAARIVKRGLSGPVKVNGVVYNNNMTALGLDDQEVADVLNYILSAWGNRAERRFTAAEIAAY